MEGKRIKRILDASPDYFESFADTAAAKPWVRRVADSAADAGAPRKQK